MHLKSTAAVCLGFVIAGFAAMPADAQTRQRDGTVISERGEDGRVRTKVIIERRSFLDGGTEVLPGSQPTTTNAMPYGYSPLASTIEGTNIGGIRHPLPGPNDMLGKDGPF